MQTIATSRLEAALAAATDALLAELGPDGHWTGELSASALSTATAVTALALVDRERHSDLIAGGLRWLAAHRNADGGWGDTVKSRSNISTTALCMAAFGAGGSNAEHRAVFDDVRAHFGRTLGSRSPDLKDLPPLLAKALADRYGKDRTFSVPILMMCNLGGALGANGWKLLPSLPFELAALPHQVFGAMQLPVVSYALPALIAIGQVIHHHAPARFLPLRWLRSALRQRTLRVLGSLQPPNGGFLEATPLTSFVTMSLAAMGLGDHPVARRGVGFLSRSVLPDGSWPIDTNLATWGTTLAVKALAPQPNALSPEQRLGLREWLLGQQYRVEHPYTHAAPGGWAWTDLPGGVPDADDTAGALTALLHLGSVESETRQAGLAGVQWLLDLQNRDDGVPTFCRGWGALPFDRSSADITAHALRAWSAWLPQLSGRQAARTRRAILRALRFLASAQQADGSWNPLWFGNEHAPDDINPAYGTAQVLIALRDLRERGYDTQTRDLRARGMKWLAEAQNDDGGWGGVRGAPSSVEETALAVDALAGSAEVRAVDRGVEWLMERVESGAWRNPAPIGFYFAKLWYFERLYPLVFTVGALGRVAALQKSLSS